MPRFLLHRLIAVAASIAAAAPIAVAAPGASTAAHADATAPLTIQLTALRSDRGQAGCSLYRGPAGFPKDTTRAVQRLWCPIHDGAARCRFAPIAAGDYAVACFHDENGNGRMDTGLFGIPKEGTAVSNDAHGTLGPPRWSDARFHFAAQPLELPLRMTY